VIVETARITNSNDEERPNARFVAETIAGKIRAGSE
jgi:hypothetical protein